MKSIVKSIAKYGKLAPNKEIGSSRDLSGKVSLDLNEAKKRILRNDINNYNTNSSEMIITNMDSLSLKKGDYIMTPLVGEIKEDIFPDEGIKVPGMVICSSLLISCYSVSEKPHHFIIIHFENQHTDSVCNLTNELKSLGLTLKLVHFSEGYTLENLALNRSQSVIKLLNKLDLHNDKQIKVIEEGERKAQKGNLVATDLLYTYDKKLKTITAKFTNRNDNSSCNLL